MFLSTGGNVSQANLLLIFGGLGIFGVTAQATDLAGASHSLVFNIEVIPEPGTLALLSLGLAGLASVRRSRS